MITDPFQSAIDERDTLLSEKEILISFCLNFSGNVINDTLQSIGGDIGETLSVLREAGCDLSVWDQNHIARCQND